MRRSKRKFTVDHEQLKGPSENRRASLCRNSNPTGTFKLLRELDEPDAILHQCFRRMLPHLWYKIVPSSPTNTDNMAFAMGQRWDILLPVLLQQNYMKSYKDSVRISRIRFEQLEQLNDDTLDIHISHFQPKKGSKTYFICLNKPLFKNAELQIRKGYSHSTMRYYDATDRILKNKLMGCLRKDINLHEEGTMTLISPTRAAEQIEVLAPAPVITPVMIPIDMEVNSALGLDLVIFPRFHHVRKTDQILIHKRRQATAHEKMMVLVVASRWGHDSLDKSHADRIRLLRAAGRLVAYTNGYSREFGYSTMVCWKKEIHSQIIILGENSSQVAKSSNGGSVRYTDQIETDHPGYLHYLFRKVIKKIGYNSGFKEIAHNMNLTSMIQSEKRQAISISRIQLNEWFNKNKGKQLSPLEKPLDTPKHCADRIEWVFNHYGLLTNPFEPVTYIDEKWFYRQNRRRKIKWLPKGEKERGNIEKAEKPNMLSRRFPVKTMFMAVVGRPIPHRNFDGKIHIERVSKSRILTSATAHTNFTHDAISNGAIKQGDWKGLVGSTDELAEDIIELLSATYNLDDDIIDRIEVFYVTKIGENGNTKKVIIERTDDIQNNKIRDYDNKNSPDRSVTIADLKLQVRNHVGDIVEDDCTCDSEYMKTAMKRVGEAIRKKYHWIPMTRKCYLVMDNAGGHGTKATIIEYTHDLLTNYNIVIIHQIPRSPYTNVLDLGVWMSLQAVVERNHFLLRSTTKALQNTVMQTWECTDLDQVLMNVFGRLKVVLCNILKAGGKNTMVEENRGVNGRGVKIEHVIKELENGTEDSVVDLRNFQMQLNGDNDDADLNFEEI